MDLDIYLLNTSNDNEMIQKWAVLHNISIEQVRKGAITLNHDNGQWSQMGKVFHQFYFSNKIANGDRLK